MEPGLYFLKMLVNLSQYRGTVGFFNCRSIVRSIVSIALLLGVLGV